jgi:hypothetical protein
VNTRVLGGGVALTLWVGARLEEFLARKTKGPGLAKTRTLELMNRRSVELWQSVDYRWRELFESADVMSEGATREEPDGSMYYGTTSVLLPFASHGGFVPNDGAVEVARLIEIDPHARLRAVRIACLEAQVRSGGPIGRVRAELFVRKDRRGIRVDIDVEARVFVELGAHDKERTKKKVASPPSSKRPSRAS